LVQRQESWSTKDWLPVYRACIPSYRKLRPLEQRQSGKESSGGGPKNAELVVPKKLSREQVRVLRQAIRRCEPVSLGAITPLKIAVLFIADGTRSDTPVSELLGEIDSNPAFQIVPLTVEVVTEVAVLADRVAPPLVRKLGSSRRISESIEPCDHWTTLCVTATQ
jgi:hypothetical protein